MAEALFSVVAFTNYYRRVNRRPAEDLNHLHVVNHDNVLDLTPEDLVPEDNDPMDEFEGEDAEALALLEQDNDSDSGLATGSNDDSDLVSIPESAVVQGPKGFKIKLSHMMRSVAAAPNPLKLVGKISYWLRGLPRPVEGLPSYGKFCPDHVKLSKLIDILGVEYINIGSQKVINCFESSTKDEKIDFFIEIIDYLIQMGELGPDLTILNDCDLGDIILSKDTYPYGVRNCRISTMDTETKEVVKCIWIIIRISKINTLIRNKMFYKFNKYFSDRRQEPFTEDQKLKMEKNLDRLYLALRTFVKPMFEKYKIEKFRTVLEATTKDKYKKLFKCALFNHHYGQLLHMPLDERFVVNDYTYCLSWGMMLTQMTELKEDSRLLNMPSENDICKCCSERFEELHLTVLDCCDHLHCVICTRKIVTETVNRPPKCSVCLKDFECWTTKPLYSAIYTQLKDYGMFSGTSGRMKYLDPFKEARQKLA